MEIYFTKESKKDIRSILKYIAKSNSEVVTKLSDKIEYTCKLLLTMPEIGSNVRLMIETKGLVGQIQKMLNAENVIDNIRKFPVVDFEKVFLFYKVEKDKLTITRVLHSRRDIPSLFNEMEN
jgi:plasmid stabilization system protein ParE